MKLQKISVFLFLSFVSTGRLLNRGRMTRIDILDGVLVKGVKDFEIRLRSLSECVSMCIKSMNCNLLYFNKTTLDCTGIDETQTGDVMKTKDLGAVYIHKNKKACRNTVYEYSWEIDVCIRFFKTRLTWDKAKAYCEGNSSHLFTVESLVKEAIFLPKLKELQVAEGITQWWIGLHDRDIEEHFKWVSGAEMKFTNWEEGQPDDKGGNSGSSDCVLYKYNNGDQTFSWYDWSCSNTMNFICENKNFT